MAKTKAPATSTALTKFDEQMKAIAERFKKTTDSMGSTNNMFALAGGILKYKKEVVPNNEFDGVVLDYILENDFYLGKFDPDSPAPPACYALGRARQEMVPFPIIDEKYKQAATCADCPQNVFGTADVGKGKACGNHVRIALISAADLKSPETIAAAEIAFIREPVTSVQAWAAYIRQVHDLYQVPFAVVTKFRLVPHTKFQFQLLSSLVNEKHKDDPKIMTALFAKYAQAEKDIMFPYPAYQEPTAAPKAGAKGAAAGKGSKKQARAKF